MFLRTFKYMDIKIFKIRIEYYGVKGTGPLVGGSEGGGCEPLRQRQSPHFFVYN